MSKKEQQKKKNRLSEEEFLLQSLYFRKYILPDFLNKKTPAAFAFLAEIRKDLEAEADIQFHLEKARKANNPLVPEKK
jgi:hypothetical protein